MTYINRSRHGRPSTYTAGCRCAECRKANTVRCMEWRARTRPQTPEGWASLTHGSVSTYVNYGCRCDDCKKAHSEALALQRSRAKQVTDYMHGTWSAYNYRGCRCEACSRAAYVFRSKKRGVTEVAAAEPAEVAAKPAEVTEVLVAAEPAEALTAEVIDDWAVRTW